jgi:hypothetical protein
MRSTIFLRRAVGALFAAGGMLGYATALVAAAPSADPLAHRRDDATRVVKRNARQLSSVCMQAVLAATPIDTPVTMTAHVRIAPDGHVIDATVTPPSPSATCVSDQLRFWTFAPGPSVLELKAPLTFVRGSGGLL